MHTFARALCALLRQSISRKPHHSSALLRATMHVPLTKASIPTVAGIGHASLPQDESVLAVDPTFLHQWLALEKRIRASCWRDEAEYFLELERIHHIHCGKEAESWIYLRRLYHDVQTHELVS